MTKVSRQLLFTIVAFAFGLASLAGLAHLARPARMELGSPAIGGPFAMTAHDGHTLKNGDLEGRPYLVFFGYTHCPGFCPTTLLAISEVFKAMEPDKKIAALFITVDPARDTPETLKSYLENFDSRIIGLTGDSAKIQAVTKAFKIYFEKVPGENGDYTVDHTTIVYLMDKRGRFVNPFNLAKPPKQAADELDKYL